MNKKKRELEQNELADAIDSYYERIKPYVSQITLVTVALVLGVVAIAFWVYSSRSITEGQWEEFLDSTRFSDVRGMDEVAKIYPEAPAGQFALIRAADYDYLRGVNNLVKDRDDYKDKLRKAIERYKKLAGDEYTVDPFLKRRATFALGHSYECVGEFDKAREYYQQLVDEAPDASITIMAKKGIDRLDNPSVVGIYEQFKQWQPELTGPAAGPLLPERPDISFPSATEEDVSVDVPESGDGTGDSNDDSAGDETGDQGSDESSDDDAAAGDDEESAEDANDDESKRC